MKPITFEEFKTERKRFLDLQAHRIPGQLIYDHKFDLVSAEVVDALDKSLPMRIYDVALEDGRVRKAIVQPKNKDEEMDVEKLSTLSAGIYQRGTCCP